MWACVYKGFLFFSFSVFGAWVKPVGKVGQGRPRGGLTGVLDMDVASGVEKGGRNGEVEGFSIWRFYLVGGDGDGDDGDGDSD